MTGFTGLDDLLDAQRLIRSLPPLPEAFLRDRVHLDLLAEVARVMGRDPFPSNVAVAKLTGIPIYVDPAIPPGVIEFRWPDGRVEQVVFTTDPVPPAYLLAETVAEVTGL